MHPPDRQNRRVTIQVGDAVADRYRASKLLGQGNMGRVWEAVDHVLDRRVALKEVLLPLDAGQAQWDAEFTRLQREARMLARLDHTNAVSVHDVVRHDDAPVIVMQWVPLPSLRQCIADGMTWDAAGVARIGQLTLAAVRHAHERGVIHKDIKPDNVLYAPGSLKVTDFGVARDLESTTTSSRLIGTPAYIAPEQWEGQKATAKSDLWALGVMLFELVERHRPFDGPHPAAVMHAVFNRPVPEMARAGALEPVIRGLLAKDPAERMDADEAERLLQAVADGQAAPTVPVQVEPTLKLPTEPPVEKKTGEELGPLGALSNVLATLLNFGIGAAMIFSVTHQLPWDSAEYAGNHVVSRAWGDNAVWPFTVVAVLIFACACLGGLDWPARNDSSVATRGGVSIALLIVSLVLGVIGDRMTADLVGLKDSSQTVDQVGDYLLFACMGAVVLSASLRSYATFGASAKK